MQSYCLKPWDDDDRDYAHAIVREFARHDDQEHLEAPREQQMGQQQFQPDEQDQVVTHPLQRNRQHFHGTHYPVDDLGHPSLHDQYYEIDEQSQWQEQDQKSQQSQRFHPDDQNQASPDERYEPHHLAEENAVTFQDAQRVEIEFSEHRPAELFQQARHFPEVPQYQDYHRDQSSFQHQGGNDYDSHSCYNEGGYYDYYDGDYETTGYCEEY